MPKAAMIMHPSHDASKNVDAIIEMIVTSGNYPILLVSTWPMRCGTAGTHAHSGLELWRQENTAQNTGIPPEGDEAQAACNAGNIIDLLSLQPHTGYRPQCR